MSLLGLNNTTQMYQSQSITPVSPVRQAPDRSPQTEASQEGVKSPRYDSYTPSQEGLDYVQAMSEEASMEDTIVGDADTDNTTEVDFMDGTYGSPTIMPEIDQELGDAIPDDLIDPTDPTNMNTYDPEAWLNAYRDEKANPNPNEIGPSSGGSTTEEEDVVENHFDPSDFTNAETYDPSAWLANYRGEPVPEKEPTSSTPVDTETEDNSLESSEETSESSFDLQSFLSESDSIAKEVISLLTNAGASYSDTQNWLELLQSSRVV